MTSFKEFNASTVDEAVAKAADRLGVTPADLSFKVLDEGSEGFLGIGARDARIEVALPETPAQAPEPAVDDRDRASLAVDESESGDTAPERSQALEEAEAPESLSSRLSDAMDGGDEQVSTPASEETLDRTRETVEAFVSAMGLNVRVDVYDTEEYIAVDLASDHTALLIGQKGETLDALQHLVNCAVYKGRPFTKRITLDSEGYRQRRIEAIQGMAHRAARKAVREDREFKLPPMQSTERRIVHLYLQDDERVTTYSEGSGSERHVTVAPA